MRTGIRKIIENERDIKLGNYHRETSGSVQKFFYFNTAICVVDTEKKICYFDNGGYYTSSTNRNIGDYHFYFLSCKGYVEVTKEEFWRLHGDNS